MWADEQWFIRTRDRIIEAAGEEGLTFAEQRQMIADEYERAIESGELELQEQNAHDQGCSLFDRIATRIRNARKSDMHKNMDWILSMIDDPDSAGAYETSCLALAYPMGDGRDKTLRLWTVEDWNTATMIRYRKAAESTAAAAEFDQRAQQITSTMSARGARNTGALFSSDGDAP